MPATVTSRAIGSSCLFTFSFFFILDLNSAGHLPAAHDNLGSDYYLVDRQPGSASDQLTPN
ncbi:hypothetical protein BDV28DRAFT_133514 [Aspergillus coremiiformis]|uniref:Uncharacterized protein n=1 Tax=Aspergillus coremiiformis TaxID=138285 RepID=A0A5N6Z6D9_9EURO|nr:hypothetical protein BDV28DRAFT_133514 [Aspergillus coremiiformis]